MSLFKGNFKKSEFIVVFFEGEAFFNAGAAAK